MNHEEVWDDSALIDSWNEALAEYKVGHRIEITEPFADICRNTTVFMPRAAVFGTWNPRGMSFPLAWKQEANSLLDPSRK